MKAPHQIVKYLFIPLLIAAVGIGLFQVGTSGDLSSQPFLHSTQHSEIHSIPKNHLPGHGYIITEVVEEEEALEQFKFFPQSNSPHSNATLQVIRELHEVPTRENVLRFWRIKNSPSQSYYILFEDFRC
ncbi:MAG: hypothetical protein HWE14_12600 [Flavobacteriia bacterium]|nr:hypothetical protein [Flavobacteriia bacterium]